MARDQRRRADLRAEFLRESPDLERGERAEALPLRQQSRDPGPATGGVPGALSAERGGGSHLPALPPAQRGGEPGVPGTDQRQWRGYRLGRPRRAPPGGVDGRQLPPTQSRPDDRHRGRLRLPGRQYPPRPGLDEKIRPGMALPADPGAAPPVETVFGDEQPVCYIPGPGVDGGEKI